METKLINLESHIDEPIKKCVVGMALLGFKPTMSCCGFAYKGETVPKKHLGKPYMYLDLQGVMDKNIGTNLLFIARYSGWKFNVTSETILDFYADTWSSAQHPWNDPSCPHYSEVFVLAIARLEKVLDGLSPKFADTATIEDGNVFYKGISKHWQYEPTEPWVVTPETFKSL